MVFIGVLIGVFLWLLVRYRFLFVVNQAERAVLTSFGKAHLSSGYARDLDPIGAGAEDTNEVNDLYNFPAVKVLTPGFYFKFPWQKVHKVTIATQTVSMAWDPESPLANNSGEILETVTKDQLNTGLTGQVRFRVSERNLYPFLFGVRNPYVHVLGYFVSILRERIANFEAPARPAVVGSDVVGLPITILSGAQGVSINDLRKNLRELNEGMNTECGVAGQRYGVLFEASLITGIEAPQDVESALAAINTAHNHVSSEISLAQAAADQRIEQSKKAVEIQGLRVQAEVEPLLSLSGELDILHQSGPKVLQAYVDNMRLNLLSKAKRIISEWGPR